MILCDKKKKQKENKISDCSENMLPTTLNYHDTTIFGCKVNFLSNYIPPEVQALRSACLICLPQGMTKIRSSVPRLNCRERRKSSCSPIFRTYNIYPCCPDSIHSVPLDCNIHDKTVLRDYQ